MLDTPAVLVAPPPAIAPQSRAPSRRPPPHHSGVLPAVQSLLTVLVAAIFITTFTVQPIRIPSGSMEPTVLIGDFLLMNRQAAAVHDGPLMPSSPIRRGDIVVFHEQVGPPAIHLIKRVVAIPGDRLHLRGGILYLNGQPVAEPFTVHRPSAPDLFRDDFPSLYTMDPRIDPRWWASLRSHAAGGELTVPPDRYFVMGDNRNDSEDSRYWGFVPRSAIVGEPLVIYFSVRQPGEAEAAKAPHGSLASRFAFARWERTFRIVR